MHEHSAWVRDSPECKPINTKMGLTGNDLNFISVCIECAFT